MAFTQPKMVTPYAMAKNITINVASIAANTTLETTVPWTGIDQNSIVFCRADSLEDNLVIQNPCECTAGNVILRIANVSVGAVDPASQVFNFLRL